MSIGLFQSFGRHRGGTVSIIGALALPILLGFVALVAEFGHGLVMKTENQRIADLAAYAGALAYSATSSTSTMTSVADNVAALNGIPSSQVAVSLATSPRAAGDQAVVVKISRTNVLLLAPIVGSGSTLAVNGNADAQFAATPSACVLALNSSGTGITLSGGTSIAAPNCTVASNETVSVPCGDTITAQSVTYNGAAPSQPCTGISGSITKQSTADPLASNSAVTAAAAHASSLSSLTAPSAPTVTAPTGGNPIEFGYSTSSTQSQATTIGCTATYSSPTWTLTCATGKTYNFSTFTVDGGIAVNVVTTGTGAAPTYNFSGASSNGGSSLTFGAGTFNFADAFSTGSEKVTFGAGTFNFAQGLTVNTSSTFGAGTFNIAQGLTIGGGATVTFGAGSFDIGGGTCSGGSGTYSICNTGTSLTFGGPSTFVLASGIYNAGGSTLTLGSGSTNSFNIGASSTGYAINTGGGSFTTFADATGSGDLFQAVGNVTTGGGSCLTLSAAAQHDFNGYFSVEGGTILGSGVYSVYDYIAFGASSGGNVTCNGSSVGVSGTNVTLVTAGASTLSGSPCSGAAFCAGSGYSNISLTAPTSGTDEYLGLIGPTSSSNTAGAYFTEGSSNSSLSGAFYFPYGPLTLSGGASVGNQSGQCLQIVASQITLTGGTKVSTTSCFSSSGSAQVQLVQ